MRMDDVKYDDGEHLAFFDRIPAVAGHIEQKVESCQNCRFCKTWMDGGCECVLYVKTISMPDSKELDKHVFFAPVDDLGKCRHYRPRKEKYWMRGIVSRIAS